MNSQSTQRGGRTLSLHNDIISRRFLKPIGGARRPIEGMCNDKCQSSITQRTRAAHGVLMPEHANGRDLENDCYRKRSRTKSHPAAKKL
jgi:hypothetical protein